MVVSSEILLAVFTIVKTYYKYADIGECLSTAYIIFIIVKYQFNRQHWIFFNYGAIEKHKLLVYAINICYDSSVE